MDYHRYGLSYKWLFSLLWGKNSNRTKTFDYTNFCLMKNQSFRLGGYVLVVSQFFCVNEIDFLILQNFSDDCITHFNS